MSGRCVRWVSVLAYVSFALGLGGCAAPETLRAAPHPDQRAASSVADADRAVRTIRPLVEGRGGRLDWDHHNDLIVFSKFRGASDRMTDIYVMGADGTNERCLTCGKADVPQAGNDQPVWHPSGRYIVFQSVNPALKVPAAVSGAMAEALTQGGAGFHNDLWVMTADGDRFHKLTEVGQGEATLHAQFSHDGRKLFWGAYERDTEATAAQDPTPRGILGRRRQAARARGRGGRAAGQWSLKVADFVTDGAPRLTNIRRYRPRGEASTFYESHGFSPDDRTLLFSASIGRSHPLDLDIWTLDLATERLTQLTDTPSVWDEHAHYSPSGDHIAWVSSTGFDYTPTNSYGKTLTTELWVMKADGSEKTRMTYFNEPGRMESTGRRTIVADNAWNRDGTKIAAVMAMVGRNGNVENTIVMIDLKRPY